MTNDDRVMQKVTSGLQDATEMMRIREVYSFPNTNSTWQDLEPAENIQRQYMFETQVYADNNWGWFTGDVVPF